MSGSVVTLCAFFATFLFCIHSVISGVPTSSKGLQYPLRLQPELDALDITHYLKNERLIRFQIQCVIFDGPCDIVGRWAKPRAKAALLGECLMCTDKQKGWLDEWFEILVDRFPKMYRAAVAKYIENEGIDLPAEEKAKIHEAFSEDEIQGGLTDLSKMADDVASSTTKRSTSINDTPIN